MVTILPDSVRNYMTKFLDDQWMRENGFSENRWETSSVSELLLGLPRQELITIGSASTIANAVLLMQEHSVSQLPVVDSGVLVGIVTESDLLAKLVQGRAIHASAVAEVMFRNVITVHERDDAGSLSKMFSEGLVGLVVDDQRHLTGIVTKLDLVELLTRKVDTAR